MKRIKSISDVNPALGVGQIQERVKVAFSTTEHFPVTDRGVEIVNQARNCYSAMHDIRDRRRRSRRYYRGDQWSDMVEHNGRMMTEEEYIQSQGKPALKQNLIRLPVRNIIGQYRSNPFKSLIYARNADNKKGAEMMSVAYESAYEMNDGRERDARMMEEFLVSGMPIYCTSYSYEIKRQRSIPKFRKVDVDRFIVNPNVNDVCGDDVELIGELCDVSEDSAIAAYAKNEMEEIELRNLFNRMRPRYMDQKAFSSSMYFFFKLDAI